MVKRYIKKLLNVTYQAKYTLKLRDRDTGLILWHTGTRHTRKDVQPPKQQPMIYVRGECHRENEMKSRDSSGCRECAYTILYKRRTRGRGGFWRLIKPAGWEECLCALGFPLHVSPCCTAFDRAGLPSNYTWLPFKNHIVFRHLLI